MQQTIQFQYDELLTPAMPGLEIHVIYECESVIETDEDGRETDNTLTSIAAIVNEQPTHFERFPLEKHGEQTKRFLAILRESARQALYAKNLRENPVEMARDYIIP